MPDSVASSVSALDIVVTEHLDREAGVGNPVVDATAVTTKVPPTVSGLSPFQLFLPPRPRSSGQESAKLKVQLACLQAEARE